MDRRGKWIIFNIPPPSIVHLVKYGPKEKLVNTALKIGIKSLMNILYCQLYNLRKNWFRSICKQ